MKIETISIEDYSEVRQSLSGLVEADHGLVNIVTGWHRSAGRCLFLVGPSSKVVMASERGSLPAFVGLGRVAAE